jgi:hypothetical protein
MSADKKFYHTGQVLCQKQAYAMISGVRNP